MIDHTTKKLLSHLHRGGAYGYWWAASEAKGDRNQPLEKLTNWWEVISPSPLPPERGKHGERHIYFGVHPTNAARKAHERARKVDVAAINCLFAEFDAKDFGNDKSAALAHIDTLTITPSIIVDSGGSYHCYWLLPEPFVIGSDADRAQKAWVGFVGSDDGAKDLARVLRVPGTQNYKDAYAPNFPTVQFVIANFDCVIALETLEREAQACTPTQTQRTLDGDRATYTTDEVARAEAALSRLAPSRANDYNPWVKVGMSLVELGNDGLRLWENWSRQSGKFKDGECAAKWPTFDANPVLRGTSGGLTIASLYHWANEDDPQAKTRRNGHQTMRADHDAEPKDAGTWLPYADIMAAFGRGETGDAELLAKLCAERITYDHAERVWYLWSGQHWARDRTDLVGAFVANDVSSQYLFAAAEKKRQGGENAEEVVKDLQRRAGTLRFRNRIANVLTLAASQPALALTGDEWDRDPYLLGCANGVINLRDGTFRASEPRDYLNTIAPTEWDGLDAPAIRWEQFLYEIFNADNQLGAFVQRLLGYGMTGLASEHVLPVLYGEGRNGKDTLLETLAHVLGGLASPVSGDVLIDSGRNPNTATPNLYALRPLRLAWVSETNEGARLNAGQVKHLTGGGRIVARPLYGKPITFKPQYLLMLVTNHKPHANADDYALWKRLHLIPFTQAFVDEPRAENEHQRDPHLAEKLRAEAPGILAWLVNGCLEWQRQGLNPPDAVRVATEGYQAEEDTIADFINERCVVTPNAEAKGSDLYARYSEWTKASGIYAMSAMAFGRRVAKRFKKRESHGAVYLGVGLLQ